MAPPFTAIVGCEHRMERVLGLPHATRPSRLPSAGRGSAATGLVSILPPSPDFAPCGAIPPLSDRAVADDRQTIGRAPGRNGPS